MSDWSLLAETLTEGGYAVARGAISLARLNEIDRLCQQTPDEFQSRRNGGGAYGMRQLLAAVPQLCEFAAAEPLIGLARMALGTSARPVKATWFDKTGDANWPVPWHQDVTITVKHGLQVPGFELRPVKDGVVHVLPPVHVSERMLALRVHLDDADETHGALRVIPGSHGVGRLSPDQVNDWVAGTSADCVSVRAGDVMLMRPLLLHASSPCQVPGHRRVVHIEYSADDLPGGLEWTG